MTAAVAAVSRLLMGVGATLIGVVYVSHKNSDGGSESSEPSTTSKVISALLDKNPKSSTAPVQVAPPQPTQPLNMTVHVPNTNQSSWTWTIVIASVGVGATAVIYYYSKDKMINKKLTDIFAFQKKSKQEISDTIRNEVQASTTTVQGTVETHVSAVKDKLHETDEKIGGLQETTQNISDTAHRTHNQISGLREDTNYFANKMISNQNAHFNNIQNSLQYLSNQNMAAMGRLIHSIENKNVNNHQQRYRALPAPGGCHTARGQARVHANNRQQSLPYYPRTLGNEFSHLSSPPHPSHYEQRSQSYHNTPPPYPNASSRNGYMNRHNSDSHIDIRSNSHVHDTRATTNSRNNINNHSFRSVPQTPIANHYNYNSYYDNGNNNGGTIMSPMSSVRRSSTIKKDTIVTTRELVEDIETSHSCTPSQRVQLVPNAHQSTQSAKQSRPQSPKGWNKWFKGL